ncbi:MAG: HAMP domain-containing sensor histidine kinase [Oscillospiraceae bacterium]
MYKKANELNAEQICVNEIEEYINNSKAKNNFGTLMKALQIGAKNNLQASFVWVIVSDKERAYFYTQDNLVEIHNETIKTFCENIRERSICFKGNDLKQILRGIDCITDEISDIKIIKIDNSCEPVIGLIFGYLKNKISIDEDNNILIDYLTPKIQIEVLKHKLEVQSEMLESNDLKIIELENKISQANKYIEYYTTLSHEFKTPINVILTSTELLSLKLKKNENALYAENYKRECDIITTNAYRSLRLACNLLDSAALASNKLRPMLHYGNIENTVKATMKTLTSIVEAKNIKLEFTMLSENTINILFDKEKVERILLNLLSNAIKSVELVHKENGIVKVYISENQTDIIITVTDNGIGLAENEFDKIFNKFYRVSNSSAFVTTGTGLGLSISKEIANLMGGNIIVKNNEDFGCSFTFTMPKNPQDLNAAEILCSSEKNYNNVALSEWSKMEKSIL